jgi:hypothetical protein
MGDVIELPSNIVDLNEYRAKRVAEGTWPPDETTVKEYWASRRSKGVKPVYTKPSGPQNSA